MKRKRRQEKRRKKKKQNFSNCRTSALGLSPPFCVASLGVLLSPTVSPACSLCMQQQWQPTGADIFLKQPPGCCVWGRLSSARLCHHLGFRAKEIARLQFGHTTLPGYVFHLLLLLIPRYLSTASLLLLHLSRKAVTLMKNSIVSGSLHIHIAVRKVLS